MNLIKRQKPVFTSLIDDLFLNQDWSHIHRDVPAVNILEVDDRFTIELAAPGNKKEDFTIELEDGLLTISSEVESKSTETGTSYTRKEFGFSSFRRSFNIELFVNCFFATGFGLYDCEYVLVGFGSATRSFIVLICLNSLRTADCTSSRITFRRALIKSFEFIFSF